MYIKTCVYKYRHNNIPASFCRNIKTYIQACVDTDRHTLRHIFVKNVHIDKHLNIHIYIYLIETMWRNHLLAHHYHIWYGVTNVSTNELKFLRMEFSPRAKLRLMYAVSGHRWETFEEIRSYGGRYSKECDINTQAHK